jgi:hypothetical protein
MMLRDCRKIAALALAAMLIPAGPASAAAAASQPRAPAPYPPLRLKFDPGGGKQFEGWVQTGPRSWTARPGDPAAPRYIGLDHGTAIPSAREQFLAAARLVGITAPRAVAGKEIETWRAMIDMPGKAWATAGTATAGGEEQSLFALTAFDRRRHIYTTDFFMIPTATYRGWGGVLTYLNNFGISPHVQGLPAGFAASARDATPAEQVQIFAGILDVTVLRLATDAMAARNSLLQTLQGVGRDIDTRTDCMMTPRCEFVPGALPGQGRTSIGR